VDRANLVLDLTLFPAGAGRAGHRFDQIMAARRGFQGRP
jgi:hypothetical protein